MPEPSQSPPPPAPPDLSQELGRIARLAKSQPAEAERAAQAVLALHDAPAVREVLAGAMIKQGRHRDAVAVLDPVPRARWSDTAWDALLTVMENEGRLTEAMAEAGTALERHPDSQTLVLRLARLHVLAGDTPRAAPLLERLERALAAGKSRLKPAAIASLWFLGGEYGRAIDLLQRIPVAALNRAGLKSLAQALAMAGRHTESDAVYRRMLDLPLPPGDRLRVIADFLAAGLVDEAVAAADGLDAETRATDRAKSLLKRLPSTAGEAGSDLLPMDDGDVVAGVAVAPALMKAVALTDYRDFNDALNKRNLLLTDDQIGEWADRLALVAAGFAVTARPADVPFPLVLRSLASAQLALLLAGRMDARLTRDIQSAIRRFLPDLARDDRPNGRRGDRIRVAVAIGAPVPLTIELMNLLDPRRFEVVFVVGPDHRPDVLRMVTRSGGQAMRLVADWEAARQQIMAWQPDILVSTLYSAFGSYLMYRRVAPVQCVWSEPPFADGAPASDFLLSWRPGEPPDPERFYATRPAFLDEPPFWVGYPPGGGDLGTVELPRGKRLYVCGGSMLKLIGRRFDRIIAGILRKDPDGVLVLVRRDTPAMPTLVRRMTRSFPDVAHQIMMVPTLTAATYAALLRSADAVFDTVPIGGMGTAFEGVALGIPKVASANPVPYGRWVAALYERIGVTDLIAPDDAAFIDKVVEIGRDPGYRRQLAERVAEGARTRIDNAVSAAALGRFIEAAVRGA